MKMAEYTDLRFGKQPIAARKDLETMLGCLIYPKIMRKVVRTSHKIQRVDLVKDCLYHFSKSKLTAAFQIPSFCKLFEMFTSKQEAILLESDPTMSRKRKDFREAFSFIHSLGNQL